MKLQFNVPVGQKVAKVLILGKEIAYKDYNTDYEDDNCIVSYNSWMNGGKYGISVHLQIRILQFITSASIMLITPYWAKSITSRAN